MFSLSILEVTIPTISAFRNYHPRFLPEGSGRKRRSLSLVFWPWTSCITTPRKKKRWQQDQQQKNKSLFHAWVQAFWGRLLSTQTFEHVWAISTLPWAMARLKVPECLQGCVQFLRPGLQDVLEEERRLHLWNGVELNQLSEGSLRRGVLRSAQWFEKANLLKFEDKEIK